MRWTFSKAKIITEKILYWLRHEKGKYGGQTYHAVKSLEIKTFLNTTATCLRKTFWGFYGHSCIARKKIAPFYQFHKPTHNFFKLETYNRYLRLVEKLDGARTNLLPPLFVLLFLSYNSFSQKKFKSLAEGTVRPNVILILSDDQGFGDLSITGNPYLNTPHIDELAENGALFERFYVSPVCSPTRAEILTGRYHFRGGVYSTSEGGERLDLNETTIAQMFKESGYKTAVFGKWHNGMQYPYHPMGRGFDEFYGFCSGHLGNYFDPLLEYNGKIVRGKGYIINDLTDKAIKFIEKNNENPFFIYIPFNTPHSPMQVPDKWWEKYKGMELTAKHRYSKLEKVQHTRAALAMTENIDWNVGRLMEKLKNFQLLENTIVIYLSDNGPNGYRWNDGLKGKKGSLDEGGVRSPCIFQWKNHIEPGTRIDRIAGAIDLLPTLIDLTGIKHKFPKPLDGKSLRPLLYNNENVEDRFIYSFWKGKISLRDENFMLDDQNRLYNLVHDKVQHHDISKENRQVYEKMLRAMKDWKLEVESYLPSEDKRTLPLGHPDFPYNQLPARDGKPYGAIKRSNRYPNSSFFTNWISKKDSITWEVEILEEADYGMVIYYTCAKENIGSELALSLNGEELWSGTIEKANDPLLSGMEWDKFKRIESYEKNFLPVEFGAIRLKKGKGLLTLKAKKVANSEVMDFRLMTLNRIE